MGQWVQMLSAISGHNPFFLDLSLHILFLLLALWIFSFLAGAQEWANCFHADFGLHVPCPFRSHLFPQRGVDINFVMKRQIHSLQYLQYCYGCKHNTAEFHFCSIVAMTVWYWLCCHVQGFGSYFGLSVWTKDYLHNKKAQPTQSFL